MPNIIRSDDNGVATLTFDREGASANVFDKATLEELDAHLAVMDKAPPAGLILRSAKDGVFIAGADLRQVRTLDAHGLDNFLMLGQRVFSRLASMPFPTVAAIHGACVGGGYELALACRYRVASDHRSTRIGLPETKLGILPGWGGSTRLPRLVGVRTALAIILEGATPPAKKALKQGLVDAVVPREHLHAAAMDALRGACGKPPPARWKTIAASVLIERYARRKLLEKTRGLYPAPEEALAVVCAAPFGSVAESLLRERQAIVRLAAGDTCRNLMRLFFLDEAAKKGAGDAPYAGPVAIIGAGVMGAGIATWCATNRLPVTLLDLDAARVAAGMDRVRHLLADNRALSPVEAREAGDRVTPAVNHLSLGRTRIVIEAAVERMDLKKKLFADLDAGARPDTVLATNTSALSITEIAHATRDPGRVVGIHFFNPVHRMPLVEVVVGKETREETLARALAFARAIGKRPVVVRDKPGFVVNRILMPYLLEAARFYDSGATPEEIDGAMLDFGMPMGPLRLIDEVGLDVADDVCRTLAAAFGERLTPPPLLAGMHKAGLKGRKAGAGFYLYDNAAKKSRTPKENPAALELRGGDALASLEREELAARMVALMINEAVRCLEDGVVDNPDDIDFAMVMGTGFAPFRGGPLRVADAMGAREVLSTLRRLEMEAGPHYMPCSLLIRHAEANKPFHPKT